MKDQIKKAVQNYNKIASLYAEYTFSKLLQFQLNEFIAMLPGKNVLDAGCGAGRDVAYFKEEGLDVIGIDTSEGMLKEAKKRVDAKFSLMDMRNLKFEKETFEGIWCMASLADIPKDEAQQVLSEFNRTLKKRGIIYIAVKEGSGIKLERKKKYNNEIRSYVLYSKEELENLLRKNNFKIIRSMLSDDEGTSWVEIFAEKN